MPTNFSNPESRKKHLKRTIKWRNENRDKWNEIRRKSREKNKDKINEDNRERFKKNLRNKLWAKKHYKKRRKYTKKYLAIPKNAERRKKTMQKWHLQRREKIVGCKKPIRCPVCNRKPVGSGRGKGRICVDHCHKTGKIRGWLCDDCNVALGRVNDSVKILENLIKYLNKKR